MSRRPHTIASIQALLVTTPEGCRIWPRSRDRWGYGKVGFEGKTHQVHRLLYLRLVGPVPEGQEVEHSCNNPACAHLDHLRTMSHADNQRRGQGFAGLNARKTHCPHGHAYTPENTYRDPHGWRTCRTCHRRSSSTHEAKIDRD